ncbi:hypothetical protein H6F46_16830 [Limnothrix sp. FACHB-1083]|uniref:hypothetical protein n=1 Tax=unclassified Limnothrix TaxID=2632864 RepID=UPI00168014A3|nr:MULTISPECIES: hypothetical protein [unclassified Limnothrix]MBD2162356.1 hypothetical protein [Limnothrix sp. FACHB-1083]MBD2193418.1 hypothetical protein [Limnothrix sp. FACHB-1088]
MGNGCRECIALRQRPIAPLVPTRSESRDQQAGINKPGSTSRDQPLPEHLNYEGRSRQFSPTR